MEIYTPSDDSFLLKEALENYLYSKNKNISILDMGSGSGVLAKTCIDLGFKKIIALDINLEAVKQLKKQKIKAFHSDLFSSLKNKKFDLIIFNPPYLPLNKDEPKDSQIATTGGIKGNEIIFRFLEDSIIHLNKEGNILLLYSSLSKPIAIKKKAKGLGFKISLLSKKKLFFEELYVILLENKG